MPTQRVYREGRRLGFRKNERFISVAEDIHPPHAIFPRVEIENTTQHIHALRPYAVLMFSVVANAMRLRLTSPQLRRTTRRHPFVQRVVQGQAKNEQIQPKLT